MSEPQKDTIYIDVDDEITGIIDKVISSDHKIVALVLPKRAAVLQSIVNMKLLKRNADKAKKSLVLITSEAGLLPLAGSVGLHVAKNLQSKPAIPAGPDTSDIPESLVNEEEIEPEAEDDPKLDAKRPIGDLAGMTAVNAAMPDAEETIDLDNSDEAMAAPVGKATKPGGVKKNKKLKVPNFERFRLLLLLGGAGLVLLVVGGYFALFALPKATIVINTDSTAKNATIAFTANTANKTFDEAGKVVPAILATTKKTDSQTVPATGQKDIGAKAKGTLTIKNCEDTTARNISSNASFTSASGKVFTNNEGFTIPAGKFSGGGLICTSTTVTVNVTAAASGESYNIDATSYTNSQLAGKFTIAGSNMTGGTTNIVKVVAQADVDAAKAKFTATTNEEAAKTELTNNLTKDSMYVIASSFLGDTPAVTITPKVGDPGDTVAVTSVINYTMLGVNQANLNTFIEGQLKTQIEGDKQAVLDNGLKTATFTVNGKDNPQVTMQTTATIGPKVDVDALKKEIAGKKKAATKEIIQNRPSIKGVTVNYSPFWVTKTPSNPKKVTISFEKATN